MKKLLAQGSEVLRKFPAHFQTATTID